MRVRTLAAVRLSTLLFAHFFFFQAEDGIRDVAVTGVQTCALPIFCSVYSDDRDFLRQCVLAIAPYHGRIYIGSEKVAGQTMGPGTVLPQLLHGGPGHAGGGEELGGLRGLQLYSQRVALQGDRALLDSIAPAPEQQKS